MPWKEKTTMSEREEFIKKAKCENANISALSQKYGISRKTAYKWLKREREFGANGLQDRSHKPKHNPQQTHVKMEEAILKVRKEHPDWGGRKIGKVLQRQGYEGIPSASTITAVLRRHQQIDPQESLKHKSFQRFERAHPNELWQMDFKGYFALEGGGYCHPLTVIDDHSRFLVGLRACSNEMATTTQAQLTLIFREFGLPAQMLMDNGSPWGDDRETVNTIFTIWLLRLGIDVAHGRPYHPQTQGKDERLHRTLKNELIKRHTMFNLAQSQVLFDQWRDVYNYERPHDALQLDTPSQRYTPSLRPFPEVLLPVTYEPGDIVRKVDQSGKISFKNRVFRVGKAFRHQPVALRPDQQDGWINVFFCHKIVKQFNLHYTEDS